MLSMLGIVFVVLAVLTLREYRDLRARGPHAPTLPLSKSYISQSDDTDPLLSQLPELDISTQGTSLPTDLADKYVRLTYDNYRPRKKSSPPMVAIRPIPRGGGGNNSNEKKQTPATHASKTHEENAKPTTVTVAVANAHSPTLSSASTFAPIHPPNVQVTNPSHVLHKPTVNRSNSSRTTQNAETSASSAHSAVSAASTPSSTIANQDDIAPSGTKKRSNR